MMQHNQQHQQQHQPQQLPNHQSSSHSMTTNYRRTNHKPHDQLAPNYEPHTPLQPTSSSSQSHTFARRDIFSDEIFTTSGNHSNDAHYAPDFCLPANPIVATETSAKKKKNKGKKKKANKKEAELTKEQQFRLSLSMRERRMLSNYAGHFFGLLQMEIDEEIREAIDRHRFWSLPRCLEQGIVLLNFEGSVVKLGQQHKKKALKKLAMYPTLALDNTGILGASSTLLQLSQEQSHQQPNGPHHNDNKNSHITGFEQNHSSDLFQEQHVEVLVRFAMHPMFSHHQLPPHSFMPGDLCWLRPMSSAFEQPQHQAAYEDESESPHQQQEHQECEWKIYFEGVVDNCGKDFLVASFNFPAELEAQKTQELLSGLWRIDKGPSIVSFKRMIDAVRIMTSHEFQGPPSLRHIICRLHPHARTPRQDPWDTSTPPPSDPRYHWQNFGWNTNDPELTNRDLSIDPRINQATVSPQILHNVQQLLQQQSLNQSQRDSIEQVFTNCVSLIQGPPGTGKTTTSVMLLKLWVDLGLKPALASAFSNVAVDQMLGGLIKCGINAVRIGDPERVNTDLITHTMKYREETHPLASELFQLREKLKYIRTRFGDSPQALRDLSMTYKRVKKLQKQIEDEILSSCDVILATCIGAGATVLADRTFSLILVDECTQATEPSCLIPLVKSRPDTHVVLIGDQCQLPPTMSCDKLKYTGLKVSLFERMLQIPVDDSLRTTPILAPTIQEQQDTVGMTTFSSTTVPFMGILPIRLLTQYRMHPLISSWPNKAFYDGHLNDGITAEQRQGPVGFPWPSLGPVCFVPLQLPEDSVQGKSKRNSHEAAAVVRIVDVLLAGGDLAPGDIGIVTPYVGQVRKLRQLFGDSRRRRRETIENEELGVVVEEGRYANLEIMSVDGYQGREKEVIVFSCVRSNQNGNVGFLADRRRLNVAITRARRGLVVVGNPKTLESHPVWKLWVDAMKEQDLIVQYSRITEMLQPSERSTPRDLPSPPETPPPFDCNLNEVVLKLPHFHHVECQGAQVPLEC